MPQQALTLFPVSCSLCCIISGDAQTQSLGNGRRKASNSLHLWDLWPSASMLTTLKRGAQLHVPMVPPALLQVLLLPRFLLFPVPEDPQGSSTSDICPGVICPRASCLVLLCPTPALLEWVLIPNSASVPHKAGGSAECIWQAMPSPWEGCICSRCLLQPWPTDPHALAEESLNDGGRSQRDAELEPCVTGSLLINAESPRAYASASHCKSRTEQLPPGLPLHLQPKSGVTEPRLW